LRRNVFFVWIHSRLYTCLTSIPRLREKVKLRLLKLPFYGVDVVEWSRALDVRLSKWCCSVGSNPVEGRTKIWQLKNLILTLFGLIFRRIYIYIYIHATASNVVQILSFNIVVLQYNDLHFCVYVKCVLPEEYLCSSFKTYKSSFNR
jgi:hypothetical protein